MAKKNVAGVVTGNLTIPQTKKLDMATKQGIVAPGNGKVRQFKKVLVDPELVLAQLAEQNLNVPELVSAMENAANQVVIKGSVRISGMKDGVAQTDKEGKERNHSLTAYVAFHVQNVESLLVDGAKTGEELDETLKSELAEALL